MTYSPTPKSLYAYEFKSSISDNSGVTFKQVRMKEMDNTNIKMESITDTTSLQSKECKNIEYCINELEFSSKRIEKKTLGEEQSALNCSRIDKLFGKEDIMNKMNFRKNKKNILPKSGKDPEINYIPTPKLLLNTNNINTKRFEYVSSLTNKQDRIKEIENINNRIESLTDSLSLSLKRCKQTEYYKAKLKKKSNNIQNRKLIVQESFMNCSRIHEIFGEENIKDNITFRKDNEYIPPKCGKVSDVAYIPTPKILLHANELNSTKLNDVSTKHVQINENYRNEYYKDESEPSNSIENGTLEEKKVVMNCSGIDDNFEKESILKTIRFRKDNKYIPPKSGKDTDITYIPTPKASLYGNDFNSKRLDDVSGVTTEHVRIKENKRNTNIKIQPVTDTLNSASRRCKKNEFYKDGLDFFSNITIQKPTLKEKEIVNNFSRIQEIFGKEDNVNKTNFEKASLEYILKENLITCYNIEYAEIPDTIKSQGIEDIKDYRKRKSSSNITENMDQNSPYKDEKSGKIECKGSTKSSDQNIENLFLSSYIDKYSTNKDSCFIKTKGKFTQSMKKSLGNIGGTDYYTLNPSPTIIIEENYKESYEDNNDCNNVSLISSDEIFKMSSEPNNASLKLGSSGTENNVLEDLNNTHDAFDLDIDGWESNISKAQPMAKTKEAMAEFEMMYKDFKSRRKGKNKKITLCMDSCQDSQKTEQIRHMRKNANVTGNIKMINLSEDQSKLNSCLTKNNNKSTPPVHIKESKVYVGKDLKKKICENNLIFENRSSELSSEENDRLHARGEGIDLNKNKKVNQVLKNNENWQNKTFLNLMKPKESYIEKHQISITGEKPYTCNLCDKAFAHERYLKGHLQTHTKKKPYQCNLCDKAFLQDRYLKGHLKTHTMEKPYHCSLCDKAFSLNISLIGHLRTHTGKRPYQCSLCEKTFSLKSNLSKHMMTHTREKSNICIRNANKFRKYKIESSDESDPEVLQANVTRNKESISNKKIEEKIQPKISIKSSKMVDKLKKIRIKSDEEKEKEDPQSVFTENVKLKSEFKTKKDIHVKNYRNSNKMITRMSVLRKKSSIKYENKVPQTKVTKIKHSKLMKNIDTQSSEKSKDDPKKKIKLKRSQEEYNEKQTEAEVEDFFLSDSDEVCDSLNKDTVRESKAMEIVVGEIGKIFDIIETSTKGVWTRTTDQIEQDLQDVFQSLKLEKFEDCFYPKMYNLDINYRQLYIHFSGVDSMLLQHAYMSKLRYPNCKSIPHEHQEDMKCCI